MKISNSLLIKSFAATLVAAIVLTIILPPDKNFLPIMAWIIIGFGLNGALLIYRNYKLSKYLITNFEHELKRNWINYVDFKFNPGINYRELLKKTEFLKLLSNNEIKEAQGIWLQFRLVAIAFIANLFLVLLSIVL